MARNFWIMHTLALEFYNIDKLFFIGEICNQIGRYFHLFVLEKGTDSYILIAAATIKKKKKCF
jgi:hypothetical protein